MSHIAHRGVSIAILAALLLGTICAGGGQAAAAPTGPDAMPPHPGLYDKIKRGEVKVPQTDLAVATEAGAARAPGSAAPAALTGPIRALAVLVDFSDKVHTVTASYFDTLIFAAPQAGRGSVRDYYNEVSYGQVDIVTVNLPASLGWTRAPQTIAYYAGTSNCTGSYPTNCQKLAEDIVDAVNGVVNFANYDNNGDGQMEPIMLIHAGRGAEYTGSASDIWSHSWGLRYPRYDDGVTISKYVIMPEYWATVSPTTSDMTIGVFAHEMGHGFWGAPDLYDTGSYATSEGIGNWSLMAGGSWNGPSGLGGSPAWPDAWSRMKMGFAAPTTLASDVQGQSIPQAAGSSSAGTIFKLKNAVLAAQEYFLVENREKITGSYDEYLNGSGLAIWHVDEAKSNNQQECKLEPHYLCGSTHYMVALEQADGLLHLEKGTNRGNSTDVFSTANGNTTWNGTTNPESSSWYTSAATNIAVTGISAAGATMTANLLIGNGTPPVPSVSINDVSVTEGNSGTTGAVFTVSLSQPAAGTATVNWGTVDGTATLADSDYAQAGGTITFGAGQTTQTVTVPVNGDTKFEGNETFAVNLSSPAGLTIADGQGVGTIVNDDQAPPTIRIDDVSVNEGNSETTPANFTISLSAPAAGAVSVNWATGGGTATAGTDYVAGSGTVTFAPGDTSKTVPVTVNGDTAAESNETFNVNLSNPVGGATIADGQGVGTIVDDDQALPTLHVGGLSGTKSVSKKNWTARVTITVHNGSHNPVSGAVVTGSWSAGGSPVTCTTNRSGVCTVSVTLGSNVSSVTFTVGSVAKTGSTYIAGDNEAWEITITK